MAIRIFPEAVREMQASRSMRLRHELWHYVRTVWGSPEFPDEGRQILRDLGWGLPYDRSPLSADGSLILDNFSGEDFLFMHRNMIRMTNKALSLQGEPEISRWTTIPEPGDSDFPVPPAWTYNDPNQTAEANKRTSRFLADVKKEEYFEKTMKVRESSLTDPLNLRRLSLGALGNIAEMTIHNMMHMRWCADPGSYRPPSFNASGLSADTDGKWDRLEYDYLGDTYSSHVNPHFWYLHGWIDNLIDLWAEARKLSEINWTGTWIGGPDLLFDTQMTTMQSHVISGGQVDNDDSSKLLRKLLTVTSSFKAPSTLIELSREGFLD